MQNITLYMNNLGNYLTYYFIKQVLGPCSCVFVDYNRQKAKVGFVYRANINYINICIFSSMSCQLLHLFVL